MTAANDENPYIDGLENQFLFLQGVFKGFLHVLDSGDVHVRADHASLMRAMRLRLSPSVVWKAQNSHAAIALSMVLDPLIDPRFEAGGLLGRHKISPG